MTVIFDKNATTQKYTLNVDNKNMRSSSSSLFSVANTKQAENSKVMEPLCIHSLLCSLIKRQLTREIAFSTRNQLPTEHLKRKVQNTETRGGAPTMRWNVCGSIPWQHEKEDLRVSCGPRASCTYRRPLRSN